ncbi:hypothetical protein WICPIJ_001405 [Wickerhamomyces pijperi]|uniref:Coronin n=1 Tax=Wickerhamomyces pijperi TaxID=599730 RepID=A0A9P8QDL1_WICPI|nr:hypothetical protein WICPIJ_001405 [Wickerhamomyces pijperi]
MGNFTTSGRFVRASKYRHVYGSAYKKELQYDNIRITKNAWDSNILQTNGKYISVNWNSSGGGAFAVIPVSEVGKAPDQVSLFRGHTATVLDTAFDPFDEQCVISGGEDGKIGVWRIPDEYSLRNHTDANGDLQDVKPVKFLTGHKRKVGHVDFHPVAKGVVASSSMDYTVKIWDLEKGEDILTLEHPDLVTSFCFNYNGNLMATTSRDRKLRVWDIREKKIISEGAGHSGAKASRVTWLGNTDRLVTTGFSKLSDRQLGIWNATDIGAGPIGGFYTVDQSSGILVPLYDESTNVLYVGGKGDGNIRYFEFENDELFALSEFQSTDAQRGLAIAPKRTVNVKENEVVKIYKTVNDLTIEPISFKVPRKSEIFQDDIYPDAPSDQPALTAEEWFAGKSVDGPILISMETVYDGAEPTFTASAPASASIKEEPKKEEPKKQEPKKEEPKKEEPKKEESPVSKPAGPLDETLKSNTSVASLLDKAATLDKDNRFEDVNFQESTIKDDEWEDVKKPTEIFNEPIPKKELSKAEQLKAKVSQASSNSASASAPVKIEEEPKKKEDPKPEEPKIAKSEPKETETKTSTPPASAASSTISTTTTSSEVKEEPKPVTTATSAKPLTLKETVEKLNNTVCKFEKLVEVLVQSNLEKDERLKALEDKIEQLLKK